MQCGAALGRRELGPPAPSCCYHLLRYRALDQIFDLGAEDCEAAAVHLTGIHRRWSLVLVSFFRLKNRYPPSSATTAEKKKEENRDRLRPRASSTTAHDDEWTRKRRRRIIIIIDRHHGR